LLSPRDETTRNTTVAHSQPIKSKTKLELSYIKPKDADVKLAQKTEKKKILGKRLKPDYPGKSTSVSPEKKK
jgi:hypothetical protein